MTDKETDALQMVQSQLDKHCQLLAILARRDGGDIRQALHDAECYIRAARRALADVQGSAEAAMLV